jgi:HmuY protein
MQRNFSSTSLLALFLAACGNTSGPATPDAFVESPDAANDAGAPDAHVEACAPMAVACIDPSIQALVLKDVESADGLITDDAMDGVHTVYVNATAGGVTPTTSYVYGKFTADGLVQVKLDDEAALSSPDWDIAFRRMNIRLNSGISGPSCVQAARIPASVGANFDAVTTLPAGLPIGPEDYMDATSCTLISGGANAVPGEAQTILSGFYVYHEASHCLSMTGNVYAIQLANGRHVKLDVTAYYNDMAQQEMCNTSGTLSAMVAGGNLHLRWAYLD